MALLEEISIKVKLGGVTSNKEIVLLLKSIAALPTMSKIEVSVFC